MFPGDSLSVTIDMVTMFTKIWVVGRITNKETGAWLFCGVFTDMNTAIKVCEDKTYFIGPSFLNNEIHNEKVPWVGSFFPLNL